MKHIQPINEFFNNIENNEDESQIKLDFNENSEYNGMNYLRKPLGMINID